MPSPVKQTAEEHNIPVFQPLNFKSKEAQEELAALDADLMIVAAYGLILPTSVLEAPRLGCINIHASLLPRWRGAAPIQRAIETGDTETGITIMQMDEGLDTGDMLLKLSCPISATTTGGELHDELSKLGAQAILLYLKERENLKAEAQDDALANYAHKLSKNEAHVDWTASAETIERKVRAFNPWPVSYAEFASPKADAKQNERVRIIEAFVSTEANTHEAPSGTIVQKDKHGLIVQCGDGQLNIQKLQLAGSKAVSTSDFVNGGKALLEAGSRLI